MARRNKYPKKLAIIDVILLLLTGGLWFLVMAVREWYAFHG